MNNSQSEIRNPKSRHILVVDDEPTILKLVATRLKLAGHRVSVAMDGQAAIVRVHEEPPPDLIILDLMLPKLNGYDVCAMLKQDDRYRRIPIIMFTALKSDDEYWKGMACGADAYLTKPHSGEELQQIVGRLINAVAPADQAQPAAGTPPILGEPSGPTGAAHV